MEKKKINFLWLLGFAPILAGFLFSGILRQNAPDFIIWWGAFYLIGISALPLSAYFFSSFSDKGYGFSKVLGLLLPAFCVWTLSYTVHLPFNKVVIVISILLMAGISWGLPKTRKAALEALSDSKVFSSYLTEEMIFLFALLIACYLKSFYPDINGEEKLMDYGFFNSLLQTQTLPAPDPWLSGYAINYYYFGQYIFSFLVKVLPIVPGVAYNLAVNTCFALTFLMAYSLGSGFFSYFYKEKRAATYKSTVLANIAGFLSSCAVAVFGNSHAFFYSETSIGNKLLGLFSAIGINVGSTVDFFYPNSTRYIGYNPDSAYGLAGHADYTIHEFPVYSYMIADLHAHMISLIIVLLLTGVLFSLFLDAKQEEDNTHLLRWQEKMSLQRISLELRRFFSVKWILAGFLLGMALMCNYWDFFIYFLVCCMTAFLCCVIRSRKTFSFAGLCSLVLSLGACLGVFVTASKNPLLHFILLFIVFLISLCGHLLVRDSFSRTGAVCCFLFSLANLAALPFSMQFQMISSYIGVVDVKTSPFQFLILWVVHLLFVIFLWLHTIYTSDSKDKSMTLHPIAAFFSNRNKADVFVSGLSVCALFLLAIPEFIYVIDIYWTDYKRANTMFKFSYGAFVLLSLTMAYSLFIYIVKKVRAYPRKNEKKNRVFYAVPFVIIVLLFLIPAYYPVVSIPQRVPGAFSDDAPYIGLDGTTYLATRNSPQVEGENEGELASYQKGIQWLLDQKTGSVVICEVYSDTSYTDNGLVSSYTGLPTIVGWQYHEYLWRFQSIPDGQGGITQDPEKENVWTDILDPRRRDVEKIYTSSDSEEVYTLLKKYQVRYLIIGNLERTVFPELNEELLIGLGTPVFSEDDFWIVEIPVE